MNTNKLIIMMSLIDEKIARFFTLSKIPLYLSLAL